MDQPTTADVSGRVQHAHPADLKAHRTTTRQRIQLGAPEHLEDTAHVEEIKEEINPNAAAYLAALAAYPHAGECVGPQTPKQRELSRSPAERGKQLRLQLEQLAVHRDSAG